MNWSRSLTIATALALLLWSNPKGETRIRGSDHDFSSQSWNPSGQICLPCHTPHHANKSAIDSPLWNHTVTQATFMLYQSSTMDATDLTQPSGRSKLCLSCHDGTVALDSYGGSIGTRYIGPAGLIGVDLSNDHPISFTYNDSLAALDGELFAPTSAASGLGGTIQNDMLFNSRMECSSCHDAHNTPGIPKMLVKSNAGSALCLTCHDK